MKSSGRYFPRFLSSIMICEAICASASAPRGSLPTQAGSDLPNIREYAFLM